MNQLDGQKAECNRLHAVIEKKDKEILLLTRSAAHFLLRSQHSTTAQETGSGWGAGGPTVFFRIWRPHTGPLPDMEIVLCTLSASRDVG